MSGLPRLLACGALAVACAACGSASAPSRVAGAALVAAPRASASPDAPAPGDADVTADEPFRYRPPALGARSTFHVEPVVEIRASSGARALLLERHDRPLVAVDAIVSWPEAPPLPGVPSVLAHMLFLGHGADGRNALDRLEMRATRVEPGLGVDSLRVQWIALPSELEATLDTFLAALRTPLAAGDLERARGSTGSAIASRSVGDVQYARASAALYPATHRYHDLPAGDAQSLAKITLAHVQRFAAAAIRPERVTFAVVGDVSRDAVAAWLERATAGWKGARATAAPVRAVAPARGVSLVADPTAADVELTVRVAGPSRDDPELGEAQLLWNVLGVRLWQAMPESDRKAWSDGATDVHANAERTELCFFVRVPRTEVAAALRVLLRELGSLANGAMDRDALEDARAALLRSLEGDASSLTDVARQLLPDDDVPWRAVGAMHDEVARASAEDLARVARARFGARDLAIVAYGDVAGLDDELRGLGLGPIVHAKSAAAEAAR